MRACWGVASIVVFVGCIYASVVKADYAEGYQAYLRGDYARAETIWRQAAWVDDDVESQTKLGDLYRRGEHVTFDPTEGYVWLFLAVINPSHTSKVLKIAEAQLTDIFDGIKQLDELAAQMSTEERREAELRITYILASRGAEGFVRLGELYAEDALFDETQACDGALGSLKTQMPLQSITNVNVDPSVYLYCSPDKYANTSVIQKNSVDSYAYLIMARDRGYRRAGEMVDQYTVTLRKSKVAFRRVEITPEQRKEIIRKILDRAREIALYWELPFEIYPGGHSDESPFGYERTKALSRVAKEVPCEAVQRALYFLGFYKGQVDCKSGSATRDAAMRYQATLGHPTTGSLKPAEVVVLIKTAATKGDVASQERLGEMYFFGVGEPLNYARARHWFDRSADQKDPYALYNLGIMYRDGLGVDVDYDQAAVYLMEATQQNCPDDLKAKVKKQLAAMDAFPPVGEAPKR